MNEAAPSLLVATANQIAFVKVVGRANVASSVHFKSLIGHLQEVGFKNYVIDLSECSTMDSTFLGVLIGLVLPPARSRPDPSVICLQLLNPNQRVTDLLDNLGVAHLFAMIRGVNPEAAALAPVPPTEAPATREEISKTCLEAHQLLMAVNPENVPKFKDVAKFLAEDLKKLKSDTAQP